MHLNRSLTKLNTKGGLFPLFYIPLYFTLLRRTPLLSCILRLSHSMKAVILNYMSA